MKQGSDPDTTAPRRPTLRTVAEIAGLAVTTVSRALSDDPKIATATRKRVAEIADQIGYVPDRAAQRLRTGKTKVITFLLDAMQERISFGSTVMSGLTRALKDTDYHLTVTPNFVGADGQDDGVETVRHIMRNNLADGVVFSRVQPFDERVRLLAERGFPFACHGRTDFSTPHAFVDFDNEAFAYMAANRLLEGGARKICMILPSEKFTFYQHLHYGLMRAVRSSGAKYLIPLEVTLDSSLEQINAWANALARSPDRPDGFIVPGEAAYIALMSGLRSGGLQRGRDFRAVVKASSGLLKQIEPEIDLVYEDIEQSGYLLGKHLLAAIQKPGSPPMQTIQRPATVNASPTETTDATDMAI
jgi:LacI family transcriptional regulator